MLMFGLRYTNPSVNVEFPVTMLHHRASSHSASFSDIHLKKLQKKAIEQQQSLYMVFIDLSKAFDTVGRSTLWTFLRRYGCPETFVKIIQKFQDGMAGAVSIGESTTDPF